MVKQISRRCTSIPWQSSLIRGLRDGLPISLGYFAVGFTVGMAARKLGIEPWQVALMSFLMHASSGQFALLTIIGAQGSYMAMFITQLVVNMRYILMSCSMSQKLRHDLPVGHRFLLGYFVTDELFGLTTAQDDALDPTYYYGAAMIASPGWVLGSALGAAIGSILPASLVSAFGVALYGMFLAVVIPASRNSRPVAIVVISSMVLSLICAVTPLIKDIPENYRIVMLTLLISATAAYIHPIDPDTHT